MITIPLIIHQGLIGASLWSWCACFPSDKRTMIGLTRSCGDLKASLGCFANLLAEIAPLWDCLSFSSTFIVSSNMLSTLVATRRFSTHEPLGSGRAAGTASKSPLSHWNRWELLLTKSVVLFYRHRFLAIHDSSARGLLSGIITYCQTFVWLVLEFLDARDRLQVLIIWLRWFCHPAVQVCKKYIVKYLAGRWSSKILWGFR